jgi:serine/threonine protein kinase
VYRAYDLSTERTVALKVIAADAGVAPEEEQRLMREGQLLEKLDHPGIVKTVAFGVLEDSGLPYVAMEWLDGEDLAQRQRRDPLTIQQATDLGIKVGEALAAAHEAGVFHRDIKPGNLFLCRSTESFGSLENVSPKIVDFGVAA